MEKPTEKGMEPKLQKAVAVDYATHIAAPMYILADKWNEVHTDGWTGPLAPSTPDTPTGRTAGLEGRVGLQLGRLPARLQLKDH
ncbi:hypothetical protein [Streptomyces lydicus]|uniref:hypothetical protein n=1 Tax=Streptomyces lydicus TaxID=47763 RepID=UPI0037B130A6